MPNHASYPYPPGDTDGKRTPGSFMMLLIGGGMTTVILAAVAAFFFFIWFWCRVEPGADQIAILIRKTGTDLPSGEIIATQDGQKGIQLEVLSEGRYFYNPYTWAWRIEYATDIPAGKFGVLTRLYGKDVASGRVIAAKGEKGITAETLSPGKYRINPYAYDIQIFDAITIRPGHVGVVTSLVGEDVLTGTIPEAERNQFLVKTNAKGVLPDTLDPGTYYLNPYMLSVAEVNLQSQRFEMSGDDVISFLTMDGFTVNVEGTIEYAVSRNTAALLTHRVGDMEDIIKKTVMPRARGFSRLEGSKHPAIDFIVGQNRQKFQTDLEKHLAEKCRDWGVDVKSVLIRRIVVPDQIASISRDREIAVQNARKFEQQISQARSEAELVRQEMLAQQNKEKVEADTSRIKAVINAQQEQQVAVTAAEKDRDVAQVNFEAATYQADSLLLRADGERDAIHARNQADADVLASQVEALGSGINYARYVFYQKIGPQIKSILAGDQQDGLGGLFTPYLPARKDGAR